MDKSEPSTVWAALASRRYLVSSWPWRSYAYLLSSVPFGALTLVTLIVAAGISAVLSTLLIGIVMLTGFPLFGVVIGAVERWRGRLMVPGGIPSPHAAMPASTSRRERLRFRRHEQASLRELGYGFLLGVFVWPLSAATALRGDRLDRRRPADRHRHRRRRRRR